MKKIILGVLSAIIAVAMFIPITSNVFAASSPAGLTINAADRVALDTSVNILVLDEYQDAVSKVTVYALDSDNFRFTNNNRGGNAGQLDFASIAEDEGTLIGKTNTYGKTSYQFTEEGRYILIALKDGYMPAMHEIQAGDLNQLDDDEQRETVNADFQPGNNDNPDRVPFNSNDEQPFNNGQMQNNNAPDQNRTGIPGMQNNNQQPQMNGNFNNSNSTGTNNGRPGFMQNMGNFFKGFFDKAGQWFPWNRR